MWPSIPLLFLLAGTPEERAIEYLAREVSKWPRENNCYSCHNNGDGARALFLAARSGFAVPDAALPETSKWLGQPANWENHQGTPGFNDAKLARIQFSAALVEARSPDRSPLLQAAKSLVPLQDSDGSWRIDTGGLPGAPATYGPALATYMARRTLEAAGASSFAADIARANQWIAAQQPGNLLDAAAMLLALPKSEPVREKCIDLIVKAQTSDGGWGPQRNVPAEVFDTAIVLLALNAAGITEPMERGRKFLIRMQQAEGGWPETTRPSGNISYAEHISTTSWALYALLTVGPKTK
jgi:hypothetical protein